MRRQLGPELLAKPCQAAPARLLVQVMVALEPLNAAGFSSGSLVHRRIPPRDVLIKPCELKKQRLIVRTVAEKARTIKRLRGERIIQKRASVSTPVVEEE